MKEYIERTSVHSIIGQTSTLTFTRGKMHEQVDSLPASGVAEVRRGRWLTTAAYPHHLYCSVCYKTYAKNAKWVNELDLPTNYCPNCGALMCGKEDENGQDPIKRSASDH